MHTNAESGHRLKREIVSKVYFFFLCKYLGSVWHVKLFFLTSLGQNWSLLVQVQPTPAGSKVDYSQVPPSLLCSPGLSAVPCACNQQIPLTQRLPQRFMFSLL